MTLEWKEVEHKFGAHGLAGYCGKFVVFTTDYDGTISSTLGKKYILRCFLSGYKAELGHFIDKEAAKAHAEQSFARWLRSAGLRQENGDA